VNIPALSQGILLSETHNFSSRMVNDFRVGFDRENVQFGGSTNGTDPTDANILNALTNVTFLTATQGFGVSFLNPEGRVVDTWQVQDNWSYLVGRNQFRAGVNFTHQLSPNTFLPGINGIFVFNSLNDYVSGQPQSLVVAQGSPRIDFKESDTFLYFADDLKLKQNLTLNLGLTWSYFISVSRITCCARSTLRMRQVPTRCLIRPCLFRLELAQRSPSTKRPLDPASGSPTRPRGLASLWSRQNRVSRRLPARVRSTVLQHLPQQLRRYSKHSAGNALPDDGEPSLHPSQPDWRSRAGIGRASIAAGSTRSAELRRDRGSTTLPSRLGAKLELRRAT
jgi:hypothetical protein